MKKKSTNKAKGRVYTPDHIVKTILNLSHYTGSSILKKHVIDNSCGDGAFLSEIVSRYCEAALNNGFTLDEIKTDLETYIHGIEIDSTEQKKCLENLSELAKKIGVKSNIKWDVICADTLFVDVYDGKMDFVLGNPPYVRVHNLETSFDAAKQFCFAQEGMTDLYIVFYEIGIKMLNKTGILGYITPSSFFNSIAGSKLRQFLVQENILETLVDLKHFQAFSATTYTAIVVLNNQKTTETVEYFQFDSKKLLPYHVETLSPEDYSISNKFYFASKQSLSLLKKIFFNYGHCSIEVKNGYATLCDNIFVGNFDFSSNYVLPVIKASRGEKKQIIYPYNRDGTPLSEEELSKDTPLYHYLLNNKHLLLNRSFERNKSPWYVFGRSQAINDTFKDKISINALLRTSFDLKICYAPAGTGVYSGLYLIGNKEDLMKVKTLLMDEEFLIYVSLLGKYKSGGYYTFSSKDLKAYFDYKLAYEGGLVQP